MHVLLRGSNLPIHIILNSTGGSVLAAQSIFDTIADADTPVTIEAKGACMSAAVLIVQACAYRWVHPNCTVMVHGSWHDGNGNPTSLVNWAAYAKKLEKYMCELFAKRSGRSRSFWRNKITKGDYFMDATEAVKLGLFDAVVGRDE